MSVAEDIRNTLHDHGGQTLEELHSSTGHIKKTLSSRLYDLKRWGQVTQDAQGAYWLATSTSSSPEEEAASTNGHGPSQPAAPGAPHQTERHQPLSGDEEEFMRLLVDCDVRRARDTITSTFFRGDVYDLNNLVEVLEDAKGYVNPNQARMVLRYWARYIGFDIGKLAKLEERLGRAASPGGSSSGDPDDAGKFIEDLGWTIKKDKDGDWVPTLGGDLSHRDSLRWAATMNATRAAKRDDDDDEDDDPKEKRGRRRQEEKDPELVWLERMKMYKDVFGGDDSGKDEEVRLLKEKLEQMERDREAERLERLEQGMAALANRNPLTDYIQMRDQLNQIAPQSSPVTDNSPTVQLIKDQSDKMTKGMDRLTGIIERAALRGHDAIEPEERYSPEERESRAGALVKKLEQGDEHKQLRQDLFGR